MLGWCYSHFLPGDTVIVSQFGVQDFGITELGLLLVLCAATTGMTNCVSKQKINHHSKHNV